MKKLVPPHGRLLIPMLACYLPLAVAATAPVAARATELHRASQPTAPITGRVTDTKGEGLPGVTVLVKGTTNGTTTGADGSYTIDAPANATLVFSSVGFAGQEIPVGNRTAINLTLSESNQALSDVVVVGYLTQKREDVTGSVASVSAVDANRAPVATLAEGIQGRLPGVTIANSGAPG